MNQRAHSFLEKLRQGNQRFVTNVRSVEAIIGQVRRDELVAAQSPGAVVLSCSDSRVPAEIVFDCGLGDLFVVRVAGNIVAPSLIGSVEFAVATFGTPLVVVMGHTRCGAIKATIDTLQSGRAPGSPNIHDIVARIAPTIQPIVSEGRDHEHTMHLATRANILNTVKHMRSDSDVLRPRVAAGDVVVVGAEYSLETGAVDFFDVPPPIG